MPAAKDGIKRTKAEQVAKAEETKASMAYGPGGRGGHPKKSKCPHGIKPVGRLDGWERCIDCSPKKGPSRRKLSSPSGALAYLPRRKDSVRSKLPWVAQGGRVVSQEEHLRTNAPGRLPAGAPGSARTPDGKMAGIGGKSINMVGNRPKRHALFLTRIKELFNEGASDMAIRFAAQTLAINESEVPESARQDVDSLYAWFTMMLSLTPTQAGDRARVEILKRIAPPPTRVEVTGKDGGPVRTTSVTGDREAQEYYEELDPPEAAD